MVQEETIVVRRLPNAYFYPFSLWPLPKYQVRGEHHIHRYVDQYHLSMGFRHMISSFKLHY